MGLLPAHALTVKLGIGVNQDHGWIENGLEPTLIASGNLWEWALAEIVVLAHLMPIFGSS